jgi:hypothetical protein
MHIQPPSSGQTPKSGPGRVGSTGPGHAPRKDTPAATPPASEQADRVELSNTAIELQGQIGLEPTPVNSMSTERLKEVGERISGGFYDRPDVKDAVVRRLVRDLDSSLG